MIRSEPSNLEIRY